MSRTSSPSAPEKPTLLDRVRLAVRAPDVNRGPAACPESRLPWDRRACPESRVPRERRAVRSAVDALERQRALAYYAETR
jgi:hypothetical protein